VVDHGQLVLRMEGLDDREADLARPDEEDPHGAAKRTPVCHQ
jgi:hypothetical protein